LESLVACHRQMVWLPFLTACVCFWFNMLWNVNEEKQSRFSDTSAIGEFHELLCGPIRKAHIHLSFILFAKRLCFFCKARKNAIRRAYCWIVSLMLVDLCSASFCRNKISAYKTKMSLCWFSECFVNDVIDIFHSRQKKFSRSSSLLYCSRWVSLALLDVLILSGLLWLSDQNHSTIKWLILFCRRC
jgi:hypothetical protein